MSDRIRTEADAIRVRDNFHLLKTEEEKQHDSRELARWTDTRALFGRSPFPQEDAANEEKNQRHQAIFEDHRRLDAGMEDSIYKEADRLTPGHGDDLRAREAGTLFLQDVYADEPPEVVRRDYERYRDDYATQKGKDQGMIPQTFFREVVQPEARRLKTERQSRQRGAEAGVRAAIENIHSLEKLAQIRQENASTPDTANLRSYLEGFDKVHGMLAPHRAMMQGYEDALERHMDGRAQEGDEALINTTRQRLLELPGQETYMVMAAINHEMARRGKVNAEAKGGIAGGHFWQQVGESFGRTFTGGAHGMSHEIQSRLLGRVADEGTVHFSGSAITSPQDAERYVQEQFEHHAEQEYVTMTDEFGSGRTVPQTGKPLALDAAATQLVRDEIARQQKRIYLQQAELGLGSTVDPIPSITASITGSAGAYAGMSLLVPPPAAAMVFGSLEYGANFDTLSLQYPGMSLEEKSRLSLMAAGISTGLGLIGARGAGPTVEQALGQSLGRTLAQVGTRRAATDYVLDLGTEAAQNATLPLVVGLTAQEAEGFDAGAEARQWLDGMLELSPAMLGMGLLRAGRRGWGDYQAIRPMQGWNAHLGAAGVVEADRVAIIQAVKEGDHARADDLLRQAETRLDDKVAAQFQRDLLQQQREAMRVGAQGQRLGLLPHVAKDGNTYAVTLNGSTSYFESLEDANAAMAAHLNEQEANQTTAVVSLAEGFLSPTATQASSQPGGTAASPAPQPGGQPAPATQTQSTGAATPAATGPTTTKTTTGTPTTPATAATPEAAMETTVVDNAMRGRVSQAEAQQIADSVFGPTPAQRGAQMRADVEALLALDSGTSATPESGPAFLSTVGQGVQQRLAAGMHSGALTPQQGLQWLRHIEKATGQKLLGTLSDAEALASADAIPRALSHGVLAEVLGRTPDGQRTTAGGISRRLDASDPQQAALGAVFSTFRNYLGTTLGTAAEIHAQRKAGTPEAQWRAVLDARLGAQPATMDGSGQVAANKSPSPRLQFSRKSPGKPDPYGKAVVQVHQRLSQGEDSFQLGRSKPVTTGKPLTEALTELATAYSRNGQTLSVTQRTGFEDGATSFWYDIATSQGTAHFLVDPENKSAILDTSELESDTTKGGGGSNIYQLAQTYAVQNGLTFLPDSSVSPKAQRRRISQMISSIFRHGTSDHLDGRATFRDSATQERKTEVPGWKPGDHDHNLALLLRMELAHTMDQAARVAQDRKDTTLLADISRLTHDAATDTIIDGNSGSPLTEGALKSLVDRLQPGVSGVGATTLLRSIVTRSAIQGRSAGGRLQPLHENPGGDTGGLRAGESDERLVSVARRLYYSRSSGGAGGLPPRRVGDALSGRPDGLASAIAETSRILNKRAPGLIHDKTVIVHSLGELKQHPYVQEHPFTDAELEDLHSAEGFFDRDTGHTVIIAGNVELRPGETPQRALTRVILHERVGHDGLNVLLQSGDQSHTGLWDSIRSQIPGHELQAIAMEDGYNHLADKPGALELEWFARKVEADPGLLRQTGSPLQRMWEALKQKLRSLMGTEVPESALDAQLKELISRSREAAVRPQTQQTRDNNSFFRPPATPSSLAFSQPNGRREDGQMTGDLIKPELSFEPSPNLHWNVSFDPARHVPPDFPFDAARKPAGQPKTLPAGDRNIHNQRGVDGENEAALVLTQNGYNYDQITKNGKKRPDGSTEGQADGTFKRVPKDKSDVFSPIKTKDDKGIHDVVSEKVAVQNAPYVIVRLEPGGQDVTTLVAYFKKYPVPDLKQLFIVKEGKLYIVY